MRSSIYQLLIVTLLFVSLEGPTDVVVDGIPHGTDVSHQSEFGHLLEAHDGKSSDAELDGEHCEHCCHGHSVGVSTMIATVQISTVRSRLQVGRTAHLHNFAQAPPTPPPNA